jgi:hypothetical protein
MAPAADNETKIRSSSIEVGHKFPDFERPAGFRYPGPLLQVYGVERRAAATPSVRTPANDPVTDRPLVNDTRASDVFYFIQGVYFKAARETAALQNGNAQACTGQLPGNGASRRS